MSNLNLAAFLIIGIAISMGIICMAMHATDFAIILFVLAGIQAALLIYKKVKHRK